MSAVDRNHKKLKLLVGAMATKTGIVGGRCVNECKSTEKEWLIWLFRLTKTVCSWMSYMHADVGRDDGG